MSLKPKIVSSSVEEFNKVSEMLDLLPEQITEQMETAEYDRLLTSLKCNLRHNGNKKQTVFVPNYTEKIYHFGNAIFVYCAKHILILGTPFLDSQVTYEMVDVEKRLAYEKAIK